MSSIDLSLLLYEVLTVGRTGAIPVHHWGVKVSAKFVVKVQGYYAIVNTFYMHIDWYCNWLQFE